MVFSASSRSPNDVAGSMHGAPNAEREALFLFCNPDDPSQPAIVRFDLSTNATTSITSLDTCATGGQFTAWMSIDVDSSELLFLCGAGVLSWNISSDNPAQQAVLLLPQAACPQPQQATRNHADGLLYCLCLQPQGAR